MLKRIVDLELRTRSLLSNLRCRFIFLETRTWEDWNDNTPASVENYWSPRLNEIDDEIKKSRSHEQTSNKMYVLSMFPYPSGRLHLGHLRVYTVSDVLARWQRLRGRYVIHPMGWDAFGLPAENAALERGLAPRSWTLDNIEAMKRQLKSMSLSLDWEREISTCNPEYYRWTQWLFLRLHEHGLTYQRQALVNWDPVDRTVLADELVDAEGRSWRSGALVEKRKLRQWFLRITNYSQSLLQGLSSIDGNQWRAVIKLQRGWIGKLNGTIIEFKVEDDSTGVRFDDDLAVFTETPEALYGVTFIVVNEANMLVNEGLLPKVADGPDGCHRLSTVAIHPLTGEKLPIVFSPTLTFRQEEIRDAELGLPSFDAKHLKIAEWLKTPKRHIFDDSEHLINSGKLNGLSRSAAKREVMKMLQKAGRGGFRCNSMRSDWLISRQRYWGTPIPIIHCNSCGPVSVPDAELPVLLPTGAADTGKTFGPLTQFPDWLKTTCPNCGAAAQRETDTMDTFVDSSWYFLRFLDPRNKNAMCSLEKADAMPVDIYVGGIEHAIRHLFYARFISHFLHDIGILPQKEPFLRFLPVGLIMGRTYRVHKTGKFLHESKVSRDEKDRLIETKTGLLVEEFWDKMSKSKHNGTDPMLVISRLGVETTRLCMLSNTGPHKQRNWEVNEIIVGVLNWQRRLWTVVGDYVMASRGPLAPFKDPDPLATDVRFQREHRRCTEAITFCYDESFVISAAIARLQQLTGLLIKVPLESRLRSAIYAEALCDMVVLLAPIVPMFSCELWSGLQFVLSAQEDTIRYDMKRSVLHQIVGDL